MRIAIVTRTPTGGAYNLLCNIQHILSKKYDVNIYYRMKLPYFFFWLGYIIPSIHAALRSDIILSHDVHWSGCISTLCAKIFRKKSIIIIMGKYYDEIDMRYRNNGLFGILMIKLLSIFEFISLNYADIIVSNDHNVTRYLEKKGVKKIFVWKYFGAIDIKQFTYNNSIRNEYREKFAIPNSDPVLIFVGWLSQWDGVDAAFNAYRILSKQYNNLWLIFIGSGDYEKSIKEIITKENLNRVILTGYVPHGEIQKYMMIGDIGLMPLKEPQCGIGSITLELMALGIPIISTDVGMLNEIIINNKTGFIVNNNVTDDIVQKINFLLKDPELLNNMKINARKEIETQFSLEKTSSQAFSLIDCCKNSKVK